ncbi:hypothetical protein J3Q64DRAFT_1739498 [Phycomyces blakesleeanus]|uniref:Peptide hydrolase n=2 Tax=Phycomyces blakesleeanus TaxID=4837 RepID=A0A162NM47_PHYB8|nr:hypothetical protein PHYBLDRAFT_77716 [Phycomyces blakesleeanus NRRL 1555(-)]OAD75478.1 hypothetical protein PHYBLDRAFT_77716 [Phycomyces blakesleeanus NRRL 1555(-)]|eukprot:XP_018293518.1 hypothetical protein PHYBLDRAFT_77716 [Phycomyces blakesleeanus NRRL 1555(-)]
MAPPATDAIDATLTERTPLLPRHSTQVEGEEPLHKNKTVQTYAFTFGFLFFISLWVLSIRSVLPVPQSDTDARASLDVFSGLHSYNEYLSKFNMPHSANQRGNAVIKDWLVELAYDFQAKGVAKGLQVDVIANDTTPLVFNKNKFGPNEYWSVESRNVMLRIVGQSNNTDEALLINAHYDSVSTSHGVTDNGMGVAVAIELARYFIKHPPHNTLVFLFNNFEEAGLIGAEQFIRHPWWSTIKLFVNLEGTGAGGRALLFRGNNLKAVHALASSPSAHYVHGSTLGNDLLTAGLLKSDTDYSTFTANGVPGLDIAFYTPRAFYHTSRDDLVHTTPNALQHMGQMALGAVRGIDESDEHLLGSPTSENMVFFDVFGRFMIVYSFETCQIINIVALVLVPLIALVWNIVSLRSVDGFRNKSRAFLKRIHIALQGLVATLIAAALIALFVVAGSAFTLYFNPLVTYGSTLDVVLYIITVAVAALLATRTLCAYLSKKTDWLSSIDRFDAQMHGLTLFWWAFVVFAAHLTSQGFAGAYFAVYFLISSTLATILYHTLPRDRHIRPPTVYIVQVLVPTILMCELFYLSIDSMRHTTADGTPETAIYQLICLPLGLIIIQLLPWVQVAGSHSTVSRTIWFLFVVYFSITLLSKPFNSELSPNRIVFTQEYNATSSLSTVNLVTGTTSIKKTLEEVLLPNEADSLTCGPFNAYQTRCSYQSSLVPLHASQPNEVDTQVDTLCGPKTCRSNITTVAQNSLLCQLQFTSSESPVRAWVGNLPVLSKDGKTEPESIGSIVSYINTLGQPIRWTIEYPVATLLEPLVSCVYDDWADKEMRAYTRLRNSLPETSSLTIRGGVGLAIAHFYPRLPI